MLAPFIFSLALSSQDRAKPSEAGDLSPKAVSQIISTFANAFTFQKIEGKEGDYLLRLSETLVRFCRCSDATVREVCKTLIVPGKDAPDGAGFEKGLICQLWFLLRYRPMTPRGGFIIQDFRLYHGDIRIPTNPKSAPDYGYDYPWSKVGGRWRLAPIVVEMDPLGRGPVELYETFSKLPLREEFAPAVGQKDASENRAPSSVPRQSRKVGVGPAGQAPRSSSPGSVSPPPGKDATDQDLPPIMGPTLWGSRALLAATTGADGITVLRMNSLAKRLGTTVAWRVRSKGPIAWREAFVPESKAERFTTAYLDDEDLNANALSLYVVQMVDRYFSLPKRSAEWPLPLPAERKSERFGSRKAARLAALALSTRQVRRSRREGWTPERLAVSARSLSVSCQNPVGLDLFVRLGRGKASKTLRVQRYRGRTFECGQTEEWPRSYREGLKRQGTTQNFRGSATDLVWNESENLLRRLERPSMRTDRRFDGRSCSPPLSSH